MENPQPKVGFFRKFPPQFWLVVMFEFFERGSYYGMMSFISVYFTDTLDIPKESVGVIKGVIQPLLYFLPILSGAIADRFGYRKVLMVAFTLLGGGYFLTSQMTTYSAVFAALVVMGIGAGTFKPIISGTIAKITTEENSTQAFGIFYWSINLGAFLFPLFLVPFLKRIDPSYVIIASAICTAAMLIPTALFFREPTKQKEVDEKVDNRNKTSLLQTLANAFEIIYSPIVLLYNAMKRNPVTKGVVTLILICLLVFTVFLYIEKEPVAEKFPTVGEQGENITLIYKVSRNMSSQDDFKITKREKEPIVDLVIYKPTKLEAFFPKLVEEAKAFAGIGDFTKERIAGFIKASDTKVELEFSINPEQAEDFKVEKDGDIKLKVILGDPDTFKNYKDKLLQEIHTYPTFRGISAVNVAKLKDDSKGRSFFLFFVISLIGLGVFIAASSAGKTADATPDTQQSSPMKPVAMFALFVALVGVWFLPGLTTLGKIISCVIYLSISSLFIIDKTDPYKFVDHAKFLLMIVLYSGFWILYFQMFDSVLWYVQAYVDASSLNAAVNSFLGMFGIQMNWFFDVEHVTVINAGTIIALQLFISSIVKKKKAMPTLLTGIAIATVGMAMLAVSTGIWVFMLGIFLFSIGEMTAHPKFISYIGSIAPSEKKAMYMGYLFLYGVFGSSVGGVLGAKLYVHFVDNLNQPRTLWLIFSCIGIFTIIALVLYNKFLAPKKVANQ